MSKKLAKPLPYVLPALLKVFTKFDPKQRAWLDELAKLVFVGYSQNGLPPDFAFDSLGEHYDLTKDQKLYILWQYQNLDMEHKHKSGITPKRQEALQRRNREVIDSFIKTGEVGIY